MEIRRQYNIQTKIDWFEAITELIDQDLEGFVSAFYPESNPKKQRDGFFLEPCPVCGHKDCCSISQGNMQKCFSCDWQGTYINSWKKYATTILGLPLRETFRRLETYYQLYLPEESPEAMEKYNRQQIQQEILSFAEKFYHDKLLNEGDTVQHKGNQISPYKYLSNIRRRKEETIEIFNIGYSKNYIELEAGLMAAGHSKEDISQTKLQYAPTGVLIYFYHHPITQEILRVNIKNPFEVKSKFYNEEGKYVDSDDILAGWSTGEKTLYCSPGFDFKKPIIVVEGENDVQAVYEQGFTNVAAIGGNVPIELWDIFNRCGDVIYAFFDNDEAGQKYTDIINNKCSDKIVKQIVYDLKYNDPDEYFKTCQSPLTIDELISQAVPMVTDNYKISHIGETWTIKDRTHSVEFVIKKRNEKGQLIGQANQYDAAGNIKGRIEDTPLVRCKTGAFPPFAFYLSDAIEDYFCNLDNLSFHELAERHFYSSRKNDIISLLAKNLYEADDKADDMVSDLKRIFKGASYSEKLIEQILIEYNNLKNEVAVTDGRIIPKMKVCQYYNLLNNDAYFYFTARKDDGDAKRAIPYLLRNDGSVIRLDLLKRKDQQCLLLVDNKYELPFEVPTAILDSMQCSLQDTMVDAYRDHKIPDSDIHPHKLVKEIEVWIRKFYFTTNDSLYKLLALWIYGTYFYVMFSQYPYLYVNGQKGSGKTLLNNVLTMLSFNGRTLAEISEASLFRMASIEGGTLMLDEQEALSTETSSRTSAAQSSIGTILKAGYTSGGNIGRFNLEKGTNDVFDPFCPKVISNIKGMDPIIKDRCIPVQTFSLSVSRDLQIEDPKYYMENDPSAYKNLTSRICFSALKYFQDLNTIYRDKKNLFESNNARLSQIISPILAIAKFVDKDQVEERKTLFGTATSIGEYEEALMEYYNKTISVEKKEAEDDTAEGIIKHAVSAIAHELAGKADREYTLTSGRKYTDEIAKNLDEGWFEVNVLHFKEFIEESSPGEKIYSRNIPRWVKTCFNFAQNEIRRKTVHIENEDLIKEMQGVKSTKVLTYKFYIKDFVKNDFLLDHPIVPACDEKIAENVF